MVRVIEVERNLEQEVYDVRFLQGIVVLPAMLTAIVAVVAWMLAQERSSGEPVVPVAMLVALWLLIAWLASKTWQRVRFTVLADRVIIDPGTVGLFSSVRARRITEVERYESLTVSSAVTTEHRTTRYGRLTERLRKCGVVTSQSNRTVVGGIGRRRAATQLSARLNAALERLRETGRPDPSDAEPGRIDS
mgnify:CR=1 FL=1